MQTQTKQIETVSDQKRVSFGKSFLGCVIDNSSFSADDCNSETIDFAESYGFKYDGLPDESSEDYSQILGELADDAVTWLNEQDLLSYCYFAFEDNSLFYLPSIENATDDIEFRSSETCEYPDDDFAGEWLHVNDHGNATLYVRNKGEDTEIWSLV